MFENHRILAVIPARGGSKGIPNKNITDLCGRPLIAHSILQALDCPYVDDVVVSTDSEKIRDVALSYGAEVPFLRPQALATDTAKTIDALLYTVEELKKRNRVYDYLLLLQPTQPVRKACHLTEPIEQLVHSGQASLVSVSLVKEHPVLMRTIDEAGRLKSILGGSGTVRRQDFPAVYKVNGSIYLNRLDADFNKDTSLNDNILPYIMDPEYAIDIDSLSDLAEAENALRRSL